MADELIEIRKLAIFNCKNFENWTFRTEILLKEYGIEQFLKKSAAEYVEYVIDGNDTVQVQTQKNKEKAELEKKECKCHSMIIQRIEDDHLEYVKDKCTAKKVWSTLIATFERKGVSKTKT